MTKHFLKDVDNLFCNYGEIDPILAEVSLKKYDQILITDMSPGKRGLQEIMGEIEVTLIDHHETSKWLTEMIPAVHDITKCATLLTWEWLRDQGLDVSEYKELAECVNDYDMWHLKRTDSLQMNMLFMKLGVDRYLERFSKRPYQGFTDDEKLIVELETERRDKYIYAASKTVEVFKDPDGLEVHVVFAEEYNSELGNHIIQELGADYVVLVNMQKRKVSLRSRKDVDVRSIAEMNGGGGHKNASGFAMSYEFNTVEFLREAGILNES
jgi:oligoribonuclease NrnB/cAMP/cGMP phosphodiesterase (DHH superfamily)